MIVEVHLLLLKPISLFVGNRLHLIHKQTVIFRYSGHWLYAQIMNASRSVNLHAQLRLQYRTRRVSGWRIYRNVSKHGKRLDRRGGGCRYWHRITHAINLQ